MILKNDCIHFPGDRPCSFNKREGTTCEQCTEYRVPGTQILIVKLDAIGDVLRTTSILHGLHEAYPGCEITWVTRKAALPLFEQNRFVKRVVAYESTEASLLARTQEYDLVINLDAAWESCVLASAATGKKKIGFGLNAVGDVYPFNKEAEAWLEMGAFDHLKKQNTRSYQEIMLSICGLNTTKKDIVLNLSAKEKEFAAAVRQRINPDGKFCLGINTGASARWALKSWTSEGFEELISIVLDHTDWKILLYGGPFESERNKRLSAVASDRVINTGTDNSLRQFFALVDICDLFLTGDTLALHAATALKKKTVAYFGPTPSAEIDSYGGRVLKVQSSLDCLCCYKPTCDFQPNCMNSISAEMMFRHVETAASEIATRDLS